MEVFSWQKLKLGLLTKCSAGIFLTPIYSHIVMFKVAEGNIEGCRLKTGSAVPLFYNASTEYHAGRTVDDEDVKHLLIYCKTY